MRWCREVHLLKVVEHIRCGPPNAEVSDGAARIRVLIQSESERRDPGASKVERQGRESWLVLRWESDPHRAANLTGLADGSLTEIVLS